jgi:hypothetical protein
MRSKNRCAIAFHDLPLGDRKKHVCGSGQLNAWNPNWVGLCKVPRGTDTSSWMVCRTVHSAEVLLQPDGAESAAEDVLQLPRADCGKAKADR